MKLTIVDLFKLTKYLDNFIFEIKLSFIHNETHKFISSTLRYTGLKRTCKGSMR
jgi:hypothetical protein